MGIVWEGFVLSLDKIRSFKEMISLNYVKAAAFCSDIESMILYDLIDIREK